MNKDWREKLEQSIRDYEKLVGHKIDAGLYSWLVSFINFLLLKQTKKVINYISRDQGWEESGDIYREHFGIPTRYIKPYKSMQHPSKPMQKGDKLGEDFTKFLESQGYDVIDDVEVKKLARKLEK